MITIIATRRFQQRLPEDSGEWRPVPLVFRKLPGKYPRMPLPQAISATVIALVVHVMLIGLVAAHGRPEWAAVLPLGLVSAAAGVTWLAQFMAVDTTRAARLGVVWMAPGAFLPALVMPELLGWCIAASVFQVAAGAVGGSLTARLIWHTEAAHGNA